MNLNTALTSALSDGTRTLIPMGLGRISQQSGNTPEYFLDDALGSVRQLTDVWAYGLPDGNGRQRQLVEPDGEITLAAKLINPACPLSLGVRSLFNVLLIALQRAELDPLFFQSIPYQPGILDCAGMVAVQAQGLDR